MNGCITVGFRNDKRLKSSDVLSAREFPVENIYCDKNHTYAVLDTADSEVFKRYIETLSVYIIEKYEDKILKRIISKKYPEIPQITINEIIKMKDDDQIENRKKVLTKILKNYFTENKSGSIEGIVNFRLFKYKKMLSTLAENAVDKYYLNREYEDFIELLRYFISIQNPRIEMIYLIVNKKGMYSILDKSREDITDKALAEVVSAADAKELAYDDLLISVLISLAPEKIIVENKENIRNRHFFETIEKVFECVEYK